MLTLTTMPWAALPGAAGGVAAGAVATPGSVRLPPRRASDELAEVRRRETAEW